ncbi:NAD-dependent epimerase/dehydratase family protein [Flammeovirga yaeyamensis]|uniref:NAD-dependent epimerase/dehydratase family protein n=1 Tax=Flammeovirga yaeyamensis TaxID=367791 RepID=A0AAX1MZN0_9BACT|nr:NAD-dependent epimerase/dehydratase family protein [Flammeovirga yaeyamensis]MBB3700958.1 UDP-glucuronate 4-epimerase [Flammeovirga yaeyamensis]NMF38065.1 NAD-dependent epimerase/dehydratase family protein [Flammeovirga yaeyamensis]QWG00715.1 NAD-dependent epimerase/dehydratase family protein [Flammeovirga yaeyamensis]
MKKILITGAAGFIGFHLSKKLAKQNFEIIGIDNINDYYPMSLKFDRLKELGIESDFIRYNDKVNSNKYNNFNFIRLDITDEHNLIELFRKENFNFVVNLAAQAGVRYSIDNPRAYISSNISGFLNILEGCRHYPVEHLVYASSSSVYGQNTEQPFSTNHRVDSPVSLYATTKRSNELMANTYNHLYKIKCTGLRFFTVYGPWGRPDMAPMLFAKAILNGDPIKVFNNGKLERDFTYIDDIINGILKVLIGNPKNRKKLYNIGCGSPTKLMDFIETMEKHLGKPAIKKMLPMQPGDVYSTFADTTDLQNDFNYAASVKIDKGIENFVNWYKKYK